ncbi:MAG: T9SS type A sorting domain-containing protein [Saprospiraceae bacterium]|nr:T9SS type A sorting domain-containing protein [Saprospiraceae bacterium]
MKYLILIFLFAFSTGLSGQITFSPAPLTMNVSPDSLEILDIDFINTQDTTFTIFWKMIVDSSTFKPEWKIYMCDLNLCYAPNVLLNAPSKPNIFNYNVSHKFQFHFDPNGVPGCTVVGLKLYTDKTFSQEIMYTCININECVNTCVSSVQDNIFVEDVKLFPNPANDYFGVKNDGSINKILIYNIFGQEIKSYVHFEGAQHDISLFKTGMYIIRCFDNNNKLVKTMKLNKILGGV